MTIFRQGDVLLRRVANPEPGTEVPRDNGTLVIAQGEATGHAHTVASPRAKLIESVNGNRYLLVEGEPAEVRHQEHATIALPVGDYQVIRQVEWTDEQEPRIVAD